MNDLVAQLAGLMGTGMGGESKLDDFAAMMGGRYLPESQSINPVYQKNSEYVRQGVTKDTNFSTPLSSEDEAAFRQWMSSNNVPFNPDATGPQDYDMRGFYKGLMSGDPHAQTGINANDNKLHFSDWWKTPYHESFSAESKWADPQRAPHWNKVDQLVTPDGRVIFDERRK